MSSKAELRQKAQVYRNNLSEEDHIRLSMMITYRLCYTFPFKEAFYYHFFVGSAEKKEILTKPLIDILLKSGRNVFVPKVKSEAQMQTHRIFSINDLKLGSYGIEEPETPEVEQFKYDCIIIPMLSADLYGNRVGYGKGFYDNFLKKTTGTKIGLVYDACVTDQKIEHEHFDVPLDILITENRVIEFPKR